ncbi:unnamed protein product [Cuscuta europaea]|uniref:Uncharacterized protein n=1 Tax=Cuscuta europaea TaxID=41803 RepID=A0A9P1EDR8_CUSEU|nr:unnamed protein product [Cuscuta europaea]
MMLGISLSSAGLNVARLVPLWQRSVHNLTDKRLRNPHTMIEIIPVIYRPPEFISAGSPMFEDLILSSPSPCALQWWDEMAAKDASSPHSTLEESLSCMETLRLPIRSITEALEICLECW